MKRRNRIYWAKNPLKNREREKFSMISGRINRSQLIDR